MNKARAAFNIIYSEGKIYMVQEDDKTWGFLGGGVDKGENALIGARREVLEETDHQISLYDYDYVKMIDISSKPNFKVVAFIYTNPSFFAFFPELKGLKNGETLQTKWVPVKDFLSMKLRRELNKMKHVVYQHLLNISSE